MANRNLKGPPKRRPPLCPPTLKLKNVGDVMSQSMLDLFSGEGSKLAFRKGDSVEAVWAEDEVFYLAVVTGVNPGEDTYDVRFTDYGNIQKGTPAAWVRPLTPVAVLEALGFTMGDVADQTVVLEDVGRLFELLQVRDCTVGGHLHANVFTGSRAVRSLLELGLADTRAAAVSVGRQLMTQGLFSPLGCSDFSDSCVALMQLNAEHPQVAACRKRVEMSKIASFKCGNMAELRAQHVAEEEEEEEEGDGSDEEFNPYKDGAELNEEAFWINAGAVVVNSRDTIARFNREARAREEMKLRELQQLFAEPATTGKKSPREGGPSPRRGSVIKTSPRRGSVIDLDFRRAVPALPALPPPLTMSSSPHASSAVLPEKRGPLVCGTLKLLRDGKWSLYYAACTDDRLQFAEDKAGLEHPVLELQLDAELTHMPEACQDPALGRQIRLHTPKGVLVMSGFVPAESYDAWLRHISAAKKVLRKKMLESSGKVTVLSSRDSSGSAGSSRVSPRSSQAELAPRPAAAAAAVAGSGRSEVVCSECLEFFPADQVASHGDSLLCRKCGEALAQKTKPPGFVLPSAGMPRLGEGPRRPPPEPKPYAGIATAKENWTATRPNCVSIKAGESLLVLASLVDYFVVSNSAEEVGLVPKSKVCSFAPRVDRLAVPTCGRGRGLGSTLRGAAARGE